MHQIKDNINRALKDIKDHIGLGIGIGVFVLTIFMLIHGITVQTIHVYFKESSYTKENKGQKCLIRTQGTYVYKARSRIQWYVTNNTPC